MRKAKYRTESSVLKSLQARVGQFTHALQCVVVVRGESAIDEEPRSLLGVGRAHVVRLEQRAYRSFGRGVLAHEITIAAHDAAEILRPRLIRAF